MDNYRVFVRADDVGRVISINSSAFVKDMEGMVEIDAGQGDRYHHAQGNYLSGPLMDVRGIYRYKMDGNVIVERTREEMDGDYTQPEKAPSYDDRLKDLESVVASIKRVVDKISPL